MRIRFNKIKKIIIILEHDYHLYMFKKLKISCFSLQKYSDCSKANYWALTVLICRFTLFPTSVFNLLISNIDF